jgi:hypothetical protein
MTRGQTNLDFAFGISLFVLALVVTFGFVPNLLAPFEAPVGNDQTVKANRANAQLLDDLTVANSSNELNTSDTNALFDTATEASLRNDFSFDDTVRVNVTLQINSSRRRTVGRPYSGQSVASSMRVVTGYNDSTYGECRPRSPPPSSATCRLIVRVW